MVGENSTGKTSILALLELFSNPDFWFSDDFSTSSYKFGGFRDIVSVADSTAKKFDVGMIHTYIIKKTKRRKRSGFFAVYQNKKGLPFCSFLMLFNGSKVISLKLHRNVIKYFIGDLPFKNVNKNIKKIFPYLKKMKSMGIKYYKKLPIKIQIGQRGIAFTALFPFIDLMPRDMRKKLGKDFIAMNPLEMIFNIVLLAPIRTRPKRTYDGYDKRFSPEGEHTPYVLRKTLASREKAKEFKTLLEKFGKTSGLFRKVKINQLGKEMTAAFELLIVLKAHPLRIDNIGYGISQVLPVAVEIIRRPKNCWFALQQPEIHLHPKAQAALGDLLFYLAEKENKRFIIETHSDFILDRFRMNMSKETHGLTTQVLFFERKNDRNNVTIIPIEKKGAYSAKQPSSFRDFFVKEQLQLLEV